MDDTCMDCGGEGYVGGCAECGTSPTMKLPHPPDTCKLCTTLAVHWATLRDNASNQSVLASVRMEQAIRADLARHVAVSGGSETAHYRSEG